MISDTLLSMLACPVTGSPLTIQGDALVSSEGRSYPVINDVPVLLPPGGQ